MLERPGCFHSDDGSCFNEIKADNREYNLDQFYGHFNLRNDVSSVRELTLDPSQQTKKTHPLSRIIFGMHSLANFALIDINALASVNCFKNACIMSSYNVQNEDEPRLRNTLGRIRK